MFDYVYHHVFYYAFFGAPSHRGIKRDLLLACSTIQKRTTEEKEQKKRQQTHLFQIHQFQLLITAVQAVQYKQYHIRTLTEEINGSTV